MNDTPRFGTRVRFGGGRPVLGLLVLLLGVASCVPAPATYAPLRSVPGSKARHVPRTGYEAYSGFLRTTARLPRGRSPTCRVDVVLDGNPGIPYEVLGYLSVERVGPRMANLRGGEEQAVGWLRTQACRVGASAIFDVRTESQWFEARGQTVRSIRGTAVAAYYLPEALLKTRPAPRSPFKAPPDGQKGRRRMKGNPFKLWLE